MSIHQTAIVDKNAKIAEGVTIGPYSVIEGNTVVGKNVKIGSHVHICKNTEIGEGTKIYTGAALGDEPQDISFGDADTYLKIGKNNIIREYVTMHRATKDGEATVIGDDCFLMATSHVAHDVKIGKKVIIANGALIAGHTQIGDMAFISGNVVIHQFCRIGKLVMIGGFSGINKDIPPFLNVRGACVTRGVNLIGLRRAGIPRESIIKIKNTYLTLYKTELNTTEALEKIESEYMCDEIKEFVEFIKSTKRGITKNRNAKTVDIEGK